MTFKKIHKRANERRQGGLPVVGTTTPNAAASQSTHTTTTTAQANGPNITPSNGPPLVVTSHSSSVVSTSTSASSSVSTSSSSSRASSSTVPTTPPAATATRASTTANAVVTRSVTTHASSTHSGTATSTAVADDSSGMSVGTMAGVAAAAIVGVAVISAFVIWLMRRRKRSEVDIDEVPFNRDEFVRHSTAIPDDDDGPLPSRIRPQPTGMSERQPTPLYGGAQTYNDMGQNSFGYSTQPSYNAQPGHAFAANGSYGPGGAPATALPHSPGFGTTYDQPGYGNGGYAELTRGGPNQHEYPPSPSYVGHDSFPSPPPVATGGSPPSSVHYPELAPAPTSAQQGHVVSVRDSVYNGRETPVQLGFAPPPAHPNGAQQPGQARAGGKAGNRPETFYDTEDAYGGI